MVRKEKIGCLDFNFIRTIIYEEIEKPISKC